jgi:colicin import membrane protein
MRFLFQLPLLLTLSLGLPGCNVLMPQDVPVTEPAIHSVAEADRYESNAARDRALAEARFVQSEALCYEKFFVNNCLDEARDVRRATLAPVRAAEVAAARFKREASVQARDRELADAEVAYQAKLKQAIIDEAARPQAPALVEPEPAAKVKKPALTIEQRNARHEEREKQAAARDKQRAAQHAERAAAQAEKKKESDERVRRVEEKKAAKATEKADH